MIYLSVNVMMRDLERDIKKALRLAGNQLVEMMKNEIPIGNTPGDPKWREQLKKDITVQGIQIANEEACAMVGVPYEELSFDMARAMQINYGGGSKGLTGKPIEAHPGAVVYNDSMTGLKQSSVKSSYTLPDEFNQDGCGYFEEAVDRMRGLFAAYVEPVLSAFPFENYVHSTARVKGGRSR